MVKLLNLVYKYPPPFISNLPYPAYLILPNVPTPPPPRLLGPPCLFGTQEYKSRDGYFHITLLVAIRSSENLRKHKQKRIKHKQVKVTL